MLRETPVQAKAQGKAKKRSREALTRKGRVLEIEEEALMDALRAARKQIADENGVPPFVVFHDATLIGMIDARPRDLNEMLEIAGIGQAKLQKYGQRFLEVLAQH